MVSINLLMNQIYINSGGNQQGPFTKSQIQTMWNEGSITMDTFYWHEGMSEWAPITQLTESEVAAATPEPPAAQAQSTPAPRPAEKKQKKLSREQKKQRKQQAMAGAASDADEGTEAEKSGGWFAELIVWGGFFGICYALVMYVACPIINWATGPDGPDGLEGKYSHTAPLGTGTFEFLDNGKFKYRTVLGGQEISNEGKWSSSGNKIKTESDDGKIKNTFMYDEDNDTLELIEGNGEKPLRREVYKKMQSSSKSTIKQSSLTGPKGIYQLYSDGQPKQLLRKFNPDGTYQTGAIFPADGYKLPTQDQWGDGGTWRMNAKIVSNYDKNNKVGLTFEYDEDTDILQDMRGGSEFKKIGNRPAIPK